MMSICAGVTLAKTWGRIISLSFAPARASAVPACSIAATVSGWATFHSCVRHKPPRVGLCRTHEWNVAQPETVAAMEHAGTALARAGAKLSEIILPQVFAKVTPAQIDIMNYEIYAALACERLQHHADLSDKLKQLLENAGQCDSARYDAAQALVASCRAQLDQVFADVDVLLAPSAPGEAPAGLAATGDPIFCRMWTVLHVPAINLPCGLGPQGLPVGVQIIGRRGDDARALAVADWVHQRIA